MFGLGTWKIPKDQTAEVRYPSLLRTLHRTYSSLITFHSSACL